jgi:WhiB family transcriptional regulator, redox-sensing transcriptional regulator
MSREAAMTKRLPRGPAEVTVPLLQIVMQPADLAELDWQDKALCAQVDPEIFFPEKGGSVRDPKRVCARCEVRPECLDYALDTGQQFGIWGGLSERERRRLKQAAA